MTYDISNFYIAAALTHTNFLGGNVGTLKTVCEHLHASPSQQFILGIILNVEYPNCKNHVADGITTCVNVIMHKECLLEQRSAKHLCNGPLLIRTHWDLGVLGNIMILL